MYFYSLVGRWSSGGSRLVTGDQNGILAIWNVSQHGHLINTPIKVVERNSPITHCLLYSPDFTPDTNSGTDDTCWVVQYIVILLIQGLYIDM